MDQMAGHNVLLIAGGLGIAPLRAPLFWINEYRSRFLDVNVLYGVKEPPSCSLPGSSTNGR